MNIGFVVAMDSEWAPFLDKFGPLVETQVVCGIEFCRFSFKDKSVFLAKCGIGEIAAASATSVLIGHFGCGYIVNFGLVGALGSRIPSGAPVLVRDVVHYDSDITAFGHPLGAAADMASPFVSADPRLVALVSGEFSLPALRLASGDKFVSDESFSKKIISDFSADICDMEGAGIALTCARSGVPFTMVKLVSDGADEGAVSSFEDSKQRIVSGCFDIVLFVIERI